MKYIVFLFSVLLSQVSWAGECIIDPNKVVFSSAEPLFISANDANRDVASAKDAKPVLEVGSPDRYLDVLKELHSSEPQTSRVWLERRILNEAD